MTTRAWLLVAVAAALLLVELVSVPLRMGLQWDEVVYVSQVGHHAPAARFDSTRAWGISILVAPVAWLTSSVLALRVYLAVASGLGLLAALWAWRRVRPDWLLALAGVLFGGLWVTQFNGPQAMVNLWSALSALAAAGCFLRFTASSAAGSAAGSRRGGRWSLAGLAAAVAWQALIRPSDAVYLSAALVIGAAAARRWQPVVATVSGLVAGLAEWVIEAEARFGGLRSRLHLASVQQGGFGLHFSVPAEWHALNATMGPLVCRPSWCPPAARDVGPALWWLALPVLVVLGVLAARSAGRLWSSLFAVLCGLSMAAAYIVMISDATARYLLPAYALLAIPVADGFGWVLAWALRGRSPAMAWPARVLRLGAGCVLAGAIVAQLVSQHLVLGRQVASNMAWESDYARVAAGLTALGVRPPCLLNGGQWIPIAYLMGCASNGWVRQPGPGVRGALLVETGQAPPDWAARWHPHPVGGTTILHYVAYLP